MRLGRLDEPPITRFGSLFLSPPLSLSVERQAAALLKSSPLSPPRYYARPDSESNTCGLRGRSGEHGKGGSKGKNKQKIKSHVGGVASDLANIVG